MAVCRECKHVQHHGCAFPECTCWQCHIREGLPYLVKAYQNANTVQHLRIALGIAISFLIQRWTYRVKVIYAGDRTVPFGTCLCGCGQQVTGSRYGRRKLYVNHAHGERAGYRRRRRKLRIPAGSPDPDGPGRKPLAEAPEQVKRPRMVRTATGRVFIYDE